MTSCLLPWTKKLFPVGSTFKGKNLLLAEPILSFKSWTPLRREIKHYVRVASSESKSKYLLN